MSGSAGNENRLEGTSRLAKVLEKRYSAEEASCLAAMLRFGCRKDSISYSEIEIDPQVKDDMILLAYEERMLLPMKSIRGSAWEDRILDYSDHERYNMPLVVRLLVGNAEETGEWAPESAARKALIEVGESRVPEVLRLLAELQPMASQGIEAGVMQAVAQRLGIELDMHDTIDRFVRCGIISPKTQRSLHSGFAKYEMNPCLSWRS
ncbi:MAG: hypothetical protein FJZ95_06985 [Chloroflexi bacterium]|nr:hypothetical protein [Chloroflexota bacterium]